MAPEAPSYLSLLNTAFLALALYILHDIRSRIVRLETDFREHERLPIAKAHRANGVAIGKAATD